MRIEADLRDDEPRIVSGVRGVKSKTFTKRFRNQAQYERWADSHDGQNCEVTQIERA